MPNYAPNDNPGHAWLRPGSIIVSNPESAEAVLQFNEEEVTALGGGKALTRPYGPLVAPVDAERAIQLVDRATGLLTGQTMTLGEILAAVHSAYLAIAADRDAAAE